MSTYKLAVLTTHPIQYQVPWFRELARRPDVELKVYFCMLPDQAAQGAGFNVGFQWDVDLLSGYEHQVLENVAVAPSVVRFRGCDTPSIVDIVRDAGHDAFIVNGWIVRSCMQLVNACRRFGVPCIVRGESNMLTRRPWWKRMLHAQLLRKYRGYLAIGTLNREFYLYHGVARDRVFWTPYGVDNEFFATRSAARQPHRDEIRARWGLEPEATVALFCGKFETKKRPADLVDAMTLVAADSAAGRVAALMAGDGDLLAACRDAAGSAELPVSFTGFLNQTEIVDAYVAADVLVLPSDAGETWGLVVNEAMACGRPAIVSDQVGCAPDLVRDGRTGFVYPCGDAAALAEKLRTFGSTPGTAQEMGYHAREHVEDFSPQRVATGIMECLTAIAG